MSVAEQARLAACDAGEAPWRRWGPYVAERAWGTVREDYSADGDAWSWLSYEDARSTAYRWNEDGLAGICDTSQRVCLTWSFWNGVDPFLKERVFGLTGPEGNHGEDAKEEWFYVDATPTSSYLAWRYRYPTVPFPYAALREPRTRAEPELELSVTGALEGCWEIALEVAKDGPDAMVLRLSATNSSTAEQVLHVLPTLTLRNTWSWHPGSPRPRITWRDGLLVEHPDLPPMLLSGSGDPLLCDNETNTELRYGTPGPAYPKDGINDHVVSGAPTVNPARVGTRGALHHVLTVAAGQTATVTVRLAPPGQVPAEDLLEVRRQEADAFYASLGDVGAERGLIVRQALAGMLWGKCYYRYDVRRWLQGDDGQPAPPGERHSGRNSRWTHLDAADVLSMPDPWEYPWFASWDLAFHAVAIAHVDPAFAKDQLLLLCREWFMHPNGQLPAYEWDFGDVNPPVHAWAALEVFTLSGGTDHDFLARVFHKLMLNFTWWVNSQDSDGNGLFAGGFLGLDNIGPFDRSHVPAEAGRLEQADGTAWMAMYCLDLLEIALVLARKDPVYEDVAVTFLEHFTRIAEAVVSLQLWDETDGFVYDQLQEPHGATRPLRIRSAAGLVVLTALRVVSAATLDALPEFSARLHRFLQVRPELAVFAGDTCDAAPEELAHDHVLAVLTPLQLSRVLEAVFDPAEFLSPHGLRSLSKRHLDAPYDAGLGSLPVDYEPGVSHTALFGGNSNWRGPVWMPINALLIAALRRTARARPALCVGGRPLSDAVHDLTERLIGLWLPDPNGHRPAGDWPPGLLQFPEYFHGETGQGLGASHQTGWTGMVADLLLRAPD
ncbi:MAG: hypothetical protein JWN31_265 [Frankiales bacterium]|nr:hypothetical protein [Frankiales bacterium]